MATIEAKVIKNIAGDIKLSASRKGGCSGCAQSKACALTWSPSDSSEDDSTLLDVDMSLSVGDTVLIECNDQSLLRYICILFLPSLLCLLGLSLLLSQLFPEHVPTFIILVGLVGSLSLGASCSHYLLNKYSSCLVTNTITPLSD